MTTIYPGNQSQYYYNRVNHSAIYYASNQLAHVYHFYVTGPVNIGHVDTNYTLLHNISYLSIQIEYFHSVTCSLKPTKCLIISAENFMDK